MQGQEGGNDQVCSSDRYNDGHRGWSIANEEEYQTGGSTLPAGPQGTRMKGLQIL